MHGRLTSVAHVAFLIAYTAVLVEFIGFGRRGGWEFALDVGVVTIGAMSIWDWWKKRQKAAG